MGVFHQDLETVILPCVSHRLRGNWSQPLHHLSGGKQVVNRRSRLSVFLPKHFDKAVGREAFVIIHSLRTDDNADNCLFTVFGWRPRCSPSLRKRIMAVTAGKKASRCFLLHHLWKCEGNLAWFKAISWEQYVVSKAFLSIFGWLVYLCWLLGKEDHLSICSAANWWIYKRHGIPMERPLDGSEWRLSVGRAV